MGESKTRIAMVGAGGMANGVHYPSLASFDDVEITAICDLNIDTAERVANQFNIDQKYTDFEKMIQSDLDIVVVSTPMPLHAPQSTIALQEDKHVISEVPAATDLQQCWELAKSVENSKKKYIL